MREVTIVKPSDQVITVEPRKVQVIEISPTVKPGPKGSQILKGSGPPPSSLGQDGDYYIQEDGEGLPFFGPKSNGSWPSIATYNNLNQRYTYNQAAVSDTWVITHPLGGYPTVTIVDSSNTVVVGTVEYNSTSQVTISFTVPFSGTAYLT
jgi:hypothetical protein